LKFLQLLARVDVDHWAQVGALGVAYRDGLEQLAGAEVAPQVRDAAEERLLEQNRMAWEAGIGRARRLGSGSGCDDASDRSRRDPRLVA
jgi:hypothetical protein